MRANLNLYFFFSAILLLLISCNKSPSFASANLNALSPTFRNIKTNILDIQCIQCHSSIIPKGGVSLSTYEEVMASPGAVVPFQPHQSQLFWQCYTGRMPEEGPHVSNLELQTLYDWIAYGAPNN